jgi:transglutaminase-like putative cysteine protease
LTNLAVHHTTIYRYRRLVTFGPHRLMLRPRDGHDLRLVHSDLELTPAGTLRWAYDVLGNSVLTVAFAQPATELRVISKLMIERHGSGPPRGQVEGSSARYPFIYSMQDRFDLGRMLDSITRIRPITLASGHGRLFVATIPTRSHCSAT